MEKLLKQGMVHIYTGDGKGKTTAAVGVALRATGAGLKVCLIQFLKGNSVSGEIKLLKRLNHCIEIVCFKQIHPMFLPERQRPAAKAKLKETIKKDFQGVNKIIFGRKYDVVILDEIINAVNQNFLPEGELAKLIDGKPKNIEIILTGRGAPQWLKKKADYVTEMRLIKHPFHKQTPPRHGIEY